MLLRRETWRYIDGSDLEFLLWIGMTFAIFHWWGKTHLVKQSSKRQLRGLAKSPQHSLSTLVGILSGPVSLAGFSFLKILLTSFGLKEMCSSLCCVLCWASGAGSVASARWNFLSKVWLSISAFSFAEEKIWSLSFSTGTSVAAFFPDKVLTLYQHSLH